MIDEEAMPMNMYYVDMIPWFFDLHKTFVKIPKECNENSAL